LAGGGCYAINLPIRLRQAADEDHDFLFRLFYATHSGDFVRFGLPAAQLDPLMRMQFKAQRGAYRAQYPDSEHSLILLDEAPIGRIWVDRAPHRHMLVDIAISPEFQGRGIGTKLIEELIAGAGAAGVPLASSVTLENTGSLRLHQRLGFEIVGHDQTYYRLEWKP
jgi:ribosomal protein S18 acetylase RimI-like enzyme